MRRWLLKIFAGLAILIVAVIVIVQVVLWTPLPKRIVTRQIEKELGLRLSADRLTTSWLGRSELTDVSLGLPLSDSDFLKVKSLKIKHSSLLGLALGMVSVDSVEVDDPRILVVQNAQGQWNLQQVIALLGRLGGGTSSQPQATPSHGSVPVLPIIKLVNGSVQITDNQNRSVSLQPLNIVGQPDGLLVWDYQLSIADSVAMTGKLAPGGNWQHQITLDVHRLDPLLKNWGVASAFSTSVKAHWSGQFSGGKLTGTLALDQASAKQVPTLGDVNATGSIDVQAAGAVVTLNPHRLEMQTHLGAVPRLGIEAGSIVSDSAGLHAQAIVLSLLGGLTHVDANFDPHTLATDLHARWSGLSLAKRGHQSGSLDASLRLPFANQPVITAELADQGTIQATGDTAVSTSQWKAKLNVTGQGNSWQDIDWVLSAPELHYVSGGRVIDLTQLSAHVNQHLPIVELTSLSLPASTTGVTNPVSFTSNGRIDFQSSKWNFDAAGGCNTTFQNIPLPVTLALHANGSRQRYDLTSLVLSLADLTFTVDGSYDTGRPAPVNLHVLLAQTPRIAPDAPVQGEVAGDFNIVGMLFEDENHRRPYLTTTGDLRSSDLVLFNRPIGNIDIKLQGDTATPNLAGGEPGPVVTKIHTTDFYLFQAPWNLTISYPNKDDTLEATLETHRLELEELARFANKKGITGQLNDAKISAVFPSLNSGDWNIRSEYHLSNVSASGVNINSVDANVTFDKGVLKLDPLVAKNGPGSITTTASVDLLNTRHLVSETTVDRWPYDLSDTVGAITSAHARIDADLKAKDFAAVGSLTGSSDLLLGRSRLAHAQIDASILNRVITVQNLSGNILTGTFNGSAKVDLDKPLQATGQVVWNNVDAATLTPIFPATDGAGGKFSGTITLGPARDPRPLQPVRVDINVASTDGHFRSMKIGGSGLLTLHAVAYLNNDAFVLDHSDFYLAGGVLHAWGRASIRPVTGLASQATIDFEDFQLNQLAHIDTRLTKPIPGILNGQIALVRSGTRSSQLLFRAHADLTQSDLTNFGPVSALYGLMTVGSSKTSGLGDIDLSFEQNVLRVTNFHYFDRGIEARGLASIGPLNYDHLWDTPLIGQVVGTARPLKDTKLPFLADFDTIFSAFEGGLSTINISGPLGSAQYSQGFISDIGKAMRELLVGEAEGEKVQ
jgi:hypothetical protein